MGRHTLGVEEVTRGSLVNVDSGPLATYRLVTRAHITVGGQVLSQVDWIAPIYLKPGDVINVEFTDADGQPLGGDIHVGARDGDIVLDPDDYQLVEDPKELE